MDSLYACAANLNTLMVLLLLTGGCAARSPQVVVPRRCIAALELTEQTQCKQVGREMQCEHLKLSYNCTEVRHEKDSWASHPMPVAQSQLSK